MSTTKKLSRGDYMGRLPRGIKLKTFDDAEDILHRTIQKIYAEGDKAVVHRAGTIGNLINVWVRVQEVKIKKAEFEILTSYERRITALETARKEQPEKIKMREFE